MGANGWASIIGRWPCVCLAVGSSSSLREESTLKVGTKLPATSICCCCCCCQQNEIGCRHQEHCDCFRRRISLHQNRSRQSSSMMKVGARIESRQRSENCRASRPKDSSQVVFVTWPNKGVCVNYGLRPTAAAATAVVRSHISSSS